MKICYTQKNGTEYAKIPGISYRQDGKVLKRDVVYLGKVIDKEANIYWNRERGMYKYDPDTRTYSDAPETYVSTVRKDERVREKVFLDFGDVFFVDQLIQKMEYGPVLDSIPYRNRDTLYAMIAYYLLSPSANCNAATWYRGSYANVLYPNANLTSQRISDFVYRLGDADIRHNYFLAHIKWLKEKICSDKAVILDSTGLPNSIDFRLAAISRHNNKIAREARLLVPVQRDSGFPLMFRAMKGNIVDISTAPRALTELQYYGMDINMVLMDAGYPSKSTIDELHQADIDYITRLPATTNFYKSIISDYAKNLKADENKVKFGGRVLFILCIEGKFEENDTYAYLGCDLNRYNDEIYKFLKQIAKGKADMDKVVDKLDKAGIFILLSSKRYAREDILPAYYARLAVEQYFDTSKGSAKLTPLRVHGEIAVYGHLILSMIASTLSAYIQKKMDRVYSSNEALFMALRNQKCAKYKTRIVLEEPDAEANEFYKKFGIEVPLYFDLPDGKTPRPVNSIRKKDP